MNDKWLHRAAGVVILVVWTGLVLAGVAAILQVLEVAR